MGSFLMLLAVLMKWAGILQMQLFQINQSEERSKITLNAHTTRCPLHELPITDGILYKHLLLLGAKRPQYQLETTCLGTLKDSFNKEKKFLICALF